MPGRRWFRWSLGGLTAIGLAWACQDASRLLTPSKGPTMQPAFDASAPPTVKAGDFVICKDTPLGTSGNFQIEIKEYFPDSHHDLRFFIASGSCRLVKTVSTPDVPLPVPAGMEAHESPFAGDDRATPGFHLVGVSIITTNDGTQELSGNNVGTVSNPASCTVTMDNGCIIIFHNSPDTPPPPPPTDAGQLAVRQGECGVRAARPALRLTMRC